MRWDGRAAKVISFLVVAAVLAVPVTLAWMGLGKIGAVLCIPLAAWFASRLLVHGGANAFSWMSHRALDEWDGAYYAFDNVQIRVYEHDERLLFAAEDVLRATGIAPVPAAYLGVHPERFTPIPGTRLAGITAEGVEALVNEHPGHDAGRFLLWAQRDVVRPWERNRG